MIHPKVENMSTKNTDARARYSYIHSFVRVSMGLSLEPLGDISFEGSF